MLKHWDLAARKATKMGIGLLTLLLMNCGGGGGNSTASAAETNNSVSAASSTPSSSSSSSLSNVASSSSSSSSSLNSSSSPTSNASSSVISPSESVTLKANYAPFSLYAINNCGVNISSPNKGLNLIGDYNTSTQNEIFPNLTGWNHATNGSTTEWKNLSRTGSTYDFTNKGKSDASCNHVDTLTMILVKKYADWDHQHANGFESHFTSAGATFGQVDTLVMDLKVNAARTLIPTLSLLKTTYSSYTSEATISNVDNAKVNIGITLYDGTSLKADAIIELDQQLLADQWLRVELKMRDMHFYSEVNYVRTEKTFDDIKSAVINGLLVVGETKTGSVLRGNMASWSSAVPETFKEMDISVKKIEFSYL